AIAIAGITLAASFAVLALVPIEPMRQLAVVMGVGILLDTLVIRSLVVPAVIAAVGPVGAWPGRFRKGGGVERPALAVETDEVVSVPELSGNDIPAPPDAYVRR